MKDFGASEKIVKVNCSFCGKEIECPESMLSCEKHACFECAEKFRTGIKNGLPEEEMGKVHVDIPMEKFREAMPQMLAGNLTGEVFPEIWGKEKENLKGMSKRSLAKAMFLAGAELMARSIIKTAEEEFRQEEEGQEQGGGGG